MLWNLNLSILPHRGKQVRVQVLCRVGRAPSVHFFFPPTAVRYEYLIPLSPLCWSWGFPQKAAKWRSATATGSSRSRVHLRNGVQTANLRRHYNAVGPTWNLLPFSWACFLQKAWLVSGFVPPRLQFSQCFMCVCSLHFNAHESTQPVFWNSVSVQNWGPRKGSGWLVRISGCAVTLKNMQTRILKNHIVISHQFEIGL